MTMDLIVREIISLISDAEELKDGKREAEAIRVERKCYEDIKNLVESLKGVTECCKS